MTPADVVDVVREAIWVLLAVAAPVMLVALGVGLVIALIQALTQVQEMTLTFVPKLGAMGIVFLLSLPMIGAALSAFTDELGARIAG